jgi:TolA-binding protein
LQQQPLIRKESWSNTDATGHRAEHEGYAVMRRVLISIILLAGVATAPVFAQVDGVGLRVEKLEKEMKAVQRKVFPNGQPIQPEMGGTSNNPAPVAGSSSALTDLTARVDALENQLKSVTGQVEAFAGRLTKIEASNKAFDGRVKALEMAAPAAQSEDDSVSSDTPAASVKPLVPVKPVAVSKPAPTPVSLPTKTVTKSQLAAPTAQPSPKPATGKVDPKLKARIDAVEIPRSGDLADDNYTYGFRLWQAKLYPEAQQQFQNFIKKYPKHKRTSYAGNLLGRAFLDEGKAALAAVAFYDNYKRDAKGERAPESVYYLGVAMTRLKRLPDACKAFAEFGDVYGATATAGLKAQVAKGRLDAKCAG